MTAAASLGCLVAASLRVVSLSRAGRGPTRQLAVAAAGFAAAVLLAVLLSGGAGGWELYGWLTVVGTVATGLLLLALIVAWLARRKANEVGLLLPVYLVGAALFVYPLFTWFALLVNSGALC